MGSTPLLLAFMNRDRKGADKARPSLPRVTRSSRRRAHLGYAGNVRIFYCVLLILAASCAGCSKPVAELKSGDTKSTEPVKTYPLHGEIKKLDTQGKIATIQHERIGDWMGAMTMDFPVKNAQEFSSLKEGEKINGTVFVQGLEFWVGEIKEDTAPPAAPPAAKEAK
jgi:Cu/Ag efflux protein CusF